MAYYNKKKVLAVVKTDQAQFPTYEGSYTITANGTYPTAYKAFVDNLVVNVDAKGIFEKGFERKIASTPNDWSNLFYGNTGCALNFVSNEEIASFLDAHSSAGVTNMSGMFANCTKITEIPLLDTSSVINMQNMFQSCYKLEEIPLLNTSKVVNMGTMFYDCRSLKRVPALDASKVTNFSGAFQNCTSLLRCEITGIKSNIWFWNSNLLSRDALNEIIGNLSVVTSTRTLNIGSTNLAKLTADDIAVATNKGWSVV